MMRRIAARPQAGIEDRNLNTTPRARILVVMGVYFQAQGDFLALKG